MEQNLSQYRIFYEVAKTGNISRAAKELYISQPAVSKSISRLEQIVAQLERGDTPLEEAMALFEEGTRLAAACSSMLDEAEQKVVKLQKGPDGEPVELPFDTEE